ncbi:hypothetical protein [Amycolatopsis sp. lyj-23]|uniref:hypothetical protein n=1 Tax=Amycolatopsis sp. lyj-23 TaxID=2789283 RepID=UPI0039785EAF
MIRPETFEEPPPEAGEGKRAGRVKVVVGAGIAAFAAVTAVIVVSAVTYRPAPPSGPDSQVLGAGSAAAAYSTYVPTYSPTYVQTDTTASSSTSTTEPTETSYSAGAVPDGYQRVTGPAGVTVSIPAGWSVQRGAFATTDEADAPDGSGAIIRYSGSPTPVMSLVDAVAQLEQTSPGIRKDYERLRLDELTSDHAGDVVWEFRFTSKTGERRHALGWYWRANDHDYAVYASVGDSRWAELQPALDVLVHTAGPR